MTGNTDLRERHASVVVVGNFNPLIFQPRWLFEQGIIGEKEAEAAENNVEGPEGRNTVEVIHKQLVVLNWQRMRLQVTLDRMIVESGEPPLVVAKDFVEKCLGLLAHTPVQQVGINFATVFRARTRADWDAFGDALAPKGPWKSFLGDEKRTGGLRGLKMERSVRPDGLPGSQTINVDIVEPIDNMDTLVNVNDHYELGQARAPAVVDILAQHWDASEAAAVMWTDELRGLCRAK